MRVSFDSNSKYVRKAKYIAGRLAIAGLFSLMVCLFFWKILFFPAKHHIPYDIGDYHFPLAYEIYDGLKHGSLPLWDPYEYSGMPLAGNINAQLFYPPTLVTVKLADWFYGAFPYRVLEYQLLFHFLLAALFAYLLARSFELSRLPSILAGTVYAFGGFFASQTQHLGLLNGAAWIPLIFYFLKRSIEERRLLLSAAAGVALSMAILAGFPALFFLTIIVTGLAALMVAIGFFESGRKRQAGFVVAALLIAIVTSVGLSAVQLLPAIELNDLSVAAEQHEGAGMGKIPAQAYLTMLLPQAFEVGTGLYWGGTDQTLSYMYLGITPFVLCFLCLLSPSRRGVFLILAVGLFGLLWAMGDTLALGGWIWLLLPHAIRGGVYNFYAKVFFDLSIGLLAAFGLQRLAEPSADDEATTPRIRGLLKVVTYVVVGLILTSLLLHIMSATTEYGTPVRSRLLELGQSIHVLILILVAVAAIVFWRLSGFLRGGQAAALLVFISILELFSFGSGMGFNTYNGDSDNLSRDTLSGNRFPISVIKSDPDYKAGKHLRIDVISRGGRVWHTACRLWGIDNFNGDDPLILEDYFAFRSLNATTDGSRRFIVKDPSSRLNDLAGVKYLVVYARNPFQPPADFRLAADGAIRVYERPHPFPRAFLVRNVEVVPDIENTLLLMQRPNFAPADTVIVELQKGQRPPILPTAQGAGALKGSASIAQYEPNRVKVLVEADQPCFLVLTDAFFPGWFATVDGENADILKADGVYRAVQLGPGKHEILFEYRPSSVYRGATITFLTLFALIGAWLYTTRPWRRFRPVPAADTASEVTGDIKTYEQPQA